MKTTYLFILVTFISSFSLCYSQSEVTRYHLKGKITDEQTQRVIANFPIKVKEFNRTINANDNGEFLFNMTAGTYTLIFDEYPYVKKEILVQLVSDTIITVPMQIHFGIQTLREINVVASKLFADKPSSITKISTVQIKELPTLIGEHDILKALSLTSGVTSSSEGSADIQVRGGLHGQNLFLLDNIPLYSTQHMFGMVSSFNPMIIRSVELYKSGFPAEYGGRIASVLDVRSKDPNLNKCTSELEFSMLTTKSTIDIPIVKNKLGIKIAGRISNYSLLSLLTLAKNMDSKIGLHFADLNAGILFKPTENDEVKLSFFYNSDKLNVKEKEYNATSSGWENNVQQNFIINWQRNVSQRTTNTLQVFTDGYKFDYGNNYRSNYSELNEYYRIYSTINSSGIENQLNSKLTDRFSIHSGVSMKIYQFSPYNVTYSESSNTTTNSTIDQYEGNLFLHTKYTPFSGQTIDAGLRSSSFGNANKSYISLEPRIAYFGVFKNNFSISASASRMTQNIHRVANPGLGIPIELFHSSDKYLKPEKSWIYDVGAAKDIVAGNKQISFKMDIWYKKMWNLVEFKDGYDAISILFSENYANTNNSSYLTQGNGNSYGIDISCNYSSSKINLLTNYTLMRAKNQFDELNNGNWFAATTDIRHSISFVSEIPLKKHWSFCATWQIQSGKPFTLPTSVYPISDINLNTGTVVFQNMIMNVNNQAFQIIETDRNNARMRPFHKLDFSFNYNYLSRKKHKSTFSFGIYNVYNRANPYLYYIDAKQNPDKTFTPVLRSISMFPILPSLSWSVKF